MKGVVRRSEIRCLRMLAHPLSCPGGNNPTTRYALSGSGISNPYLTVICVPFYTELALMHFVSSEKTYRQQFPGMAWRAPGGSVGAFHPSVVSGGLDGLCTATGRCQAAAGGCSAISGNFRSRASALGRRDLPTPLPMGQASLQPRSTRRVLRRRGVRQAGRGAGRKRGFAAHLP